MKNAASKGEIMYKLLNKLLLILMNIGTVIVAVIEFSNQDFSRLLTFVAIFPVLLVPFILNKTKFKLSEFEICMYYLFIFLAQFLGCVVNLYNIISWYDLFTHFLSGIFTFVLGFIVLKRFNVYNSKNKVMNIIFCLGFVAIVALLWEIFEFSMDNLIGSNLQHNLDTGVNDTMEDLIVATLGGVISSLYMFFKKFNI